MDLQQRAFDVNQEMGKIRTPIVHVVSLRRRDRHMTEGRVFIVKAHQAAKLIVDGTHDYATPAQIEEFEADQASRKADIQKQQAQSEQKFQLNLSPELIAAAVSAAGANHAASGKK